MANSAGDWLIVIVCLVVVALLLFGGNMIVCSLMSDEEIDYKWIFDGDEYFTCSQSPTPSPTATPSATPSVTPSATPSVTPTATPVTPGPVTPGPVTPPGPPLPLCKANGLAHTGGGGCPAQAFGAKCSSYYDPVGSVLCKRKPYGSQRCTAGERCALPPRCQCTTPAGSDGVNSPTDCAEPATGDLKYRRKLNLCTSKLSQSACENPQFPPPLPGTCQWVDQDDRYLY